MQSYLPYDFPGLFNQLSPTHSSLQFPTFLALSYLLFSLYLCICTLKISLLSLVWLEDINFLFCSYLNWKKLFSMKSARFFLSCKENLNPLDLTMLSNTINLMKIYMNLLLKWYHQWDYNASKSKTHFMSYECACLNMEAKSYFLYIYYLNK